MTMVRKLRSNFEPGTPRWAVRRAQWKALGLTDADLEKPKIAVVNTSSELSSCFSHLDGIAKGGPFDFSAESDGSCLPAERGLARGLLQGRA